MKFVYQPKRNGRIQKKYRGRYRLPGKMQIHEVALHTTSKEVAEKLLNEIFKQEELEDHGLAIPRQKMEDAQKPLTAHLTDYLADLKARGRSEEYLTKPRNRIARLCKECGWRQLRDISADSFQAWRAQQSDLSPRSKNHYLDAIRGLLNWLVENGRWAQNPLAKVGKVDNRAKEAENNRALTRDEMDRILALDVPRSLIYHTYYYTGLRRGELRGLQWRDLYIDAEPYLLRVRAEDAKSRRIDKLPLEPALAQRLRAHRPVGWKTTDKVFATHPNYDTLASDLKAAGVALVDDEERKVGFHTFRRTFITHLQLAGAHPQEVMRLARHRDARLTMKTYMDGTHLNLHHALRALQNDPLKSPLHSGQGKEWLTNSDQIGKDEERLNSSEPLGNEQLCPHLVDDSQSSQPVDNVEARGVEPLS